MKYFGNKDSIVSCILLYYTILSKYRHPTQGLFTTSGTTSYKIILIAVTHYNFIDLVCTNERLSVCVTGIFYSSTSWALSTRLNQHHKVNAAPLLPFYYGWFHPCLVWINLTVEGGAGAFKCRPLVDIYVKWNTRMSNPRVYFISDIVGAEV